MKIRIKERKYNDFLIMFILTGLLLISELALFFFNGIFNINIFGILNDVAVYFILFFMCNFAKNIKVKKTLFAFVFLFFITLFVIDSIYSNFFGGFSSISGLLSVKNVFQQDVKIYPARSSYAIFATALLGIIFLVIIKIPKYTRRHYFKSLAAMVTVLALTVGVSNFAVLTTISNKDKDSFNSKIDYYSSNTFLYKAFYNSQKFAGTFGYILFRAKDIANITATTSIEHLEEIEKIFDEKQPKEQNQMSAALEDYNVITILGETFDPRAVAYCPSLAPNLYNFMADSLVFDNYYVPTFFEGATINSQFMAQVGMLPISSTNWWSNNFGNKYHGNYFGDYSIAGQLGKNGYETYFFHNYSSSFYYRDIMMPNWGFKNTKYAEDLKDFNYKNTSHDTSIMGFFESFVDYDQKFYIDVLSYSMHEGYDNDYSFNMPAVKKALPDAKKETQVYYTKLMVFDDFIGQLLDKLDAEGVRDNTLIMLYGDHFNYCDPIIYKDFDIDVDSKEVHNQVLTMHIGGQKGGEIEQLLGGKRPKMVGSTLDIAPTVLNLVLGVGEKAEYKYFAGEDIFDEKSIVFFGDMTVFNGRTYLNPDKGEYYGFEEDLDYLADYLGDRLELCSWSYMMYDADYFKAIKTLRTE